MKDLNKPLKIIGLILCLLVLIWMAQSIIKSCKGPDQKPAEKIISTDTSSTLKEFSVRPQTKFHAAPVVIKQKINVDSLREVLWQEAKEYWKNKLRDSLSAFSYIAQADTVFEEDTSLSMNVSFISPMPIHPKSYFSFDSIKIKEKTITITKEIQLPCEKSFWDRFNIVCYGGIGYDPLGKAINTSVGIGIGYDVKKLFGSD